MKYHLITFGCQMNVADSAEMGRHLEVQGVSQTAKLEEAQVVVVNTCTVRQQAENRALSQIGRLRNWKVQDPRRVLIVAGCAATRLQHTLKQRFPHVDLITPATEIARFLELVEKVLQERWSFLAESDEAFEGKTPPKLDAGATAYVTIMRGCNYHCSYCIVPSVRGREVYRPLADILSEIGTRVREGAKEVLLLGQTVNSYKAEVDFAGLLRAVDQINGLHRIRFMSPHPRHMRERVIQAMAECRKVCEHLHLPVQSGSDRILQLMQRYYTATHYLQAVRKLRETISELTLTTDIIVGYPTETEDDFRATLELIETVGFDGLFVFKYSPRPGTESARVPDDIPTAIKEERLQRVLQLAERLSHDRHARLLGTHQEVLIDSVKNGHAYGRTRTNTRVRVPSTGVAVGDLIPVILETMHQDAFAGRRMS
ncbi:MAG: tRNA (N6-isopentenyl adenosine(37)-C2)-methylthiotransferase MiaB [Elusimicrobia bacterium]|nr:tRNA (N6-isopentenyl adenosine(37)-C2)-methylthiotransferase MiaB [Elusimicrobiota bacterium]